MRNGKRTIQNNARRALGRCLRHALSGLWSLHPRLLRIRVDVTRGTNDGHARERHPALSSSRRPVVPDTAPGAVPPQQRTRKPGWFSNLRVRTKVSTAVACGLVASAVLGGVALDRMSGLDQTGSWQRVNSTAVTDL